MRTDQPDHSDQAHRAHIAIAIEPNARGNPSGKLADAELHFLTGPLSGCKLIGFSIWERRTGGGRNVTFPARQYSVNGERRSFALLRPTEHVDAQTRVRDLILRAYASYDGPGMDTRTVFDQDGQLMSQDGGINLQAPPHEATRSTDTTRGDDDPPLQAQPSPLESSPDAAEAWSLDARMAEAAETTNQDRAVEAGVILGSMIVQKVYGLPAAPSSAPRPRRF